MQTEIFQTNPKLRGLLMVSMFTFAAGGIVLAVLAQIQAYNREQIYLAIEAALPRHREASKVENSPSTTLGTVGDIANWKTYRNEEYGFEFRYPGSFYYTEFKQRYPDYFDLLAISDENISMIDEPLDLDGIKKTLTFRIENQNELENWPDDFVSDMFDKIEKITINGYQALKIEQKGRSSNIYVFQGNGKLISLWIWPPYEPIFEKVVSTFKFIK
ncbi:MAG: hypothetical protein HYZ51_01930 [Candidatus Doudnabacteria bacterium]|nr:hypothetical protein [Candidatus Doudnabacteria bacterium]